MSSHDFHGHTATTRKDLTGTITDDEWERIKMGECITYTFHPVWIPSGMLLVFVGRFPLPKTDPRVVNLIREGASCCPYTVTDEVVKTLEEDGMVTATFEGAPFSVSFALEKAYQRAQKERGR